MKKERLSPTAVFPLTENTSTPFRRFRRIHTTPTGLFRRTKLRTSSKTEVGHNCALWFDAEAPLGTEAGLYTGVVTVSFGGTKFDIPVEINVLDIDIPLKASLDTYGAVFVRVREEFPGLPEGMART